MSPEARLNAIDEARDVFRCAVAELVARAKHIGVSPLLCERAPMEAEDVLINLFYEIESDLKEEIGE